MTGHHYSRTTSPFQLRIAPLHDFSEPNCAGDFLPKGTSPWSSSRAPILRSFCIPLLEKKKVKWKNVSSVWGGTVKPRGARGKLWIRMSSNFVTRVSFEGWVCSFLFDSQLDCYFSDENMALSGKGLGAKFLAYVCGFQICCRWSVFLNWIPLLIVIFAATTIRRF